MCKSFLSVPEIDFTKIYREKHWLATQTESNMCVLVWYWLVTWAEHLSSKSSCVGIEQIRLGLQGTIFSIYSPFR